MNRFLASVICASAGIYSSAEAANVYINDYTNVTINSIGATAMNAKVRTSNNNFDQSVATGSGTAASGIFVQGNLGNVAVIDSRSYNFSLQHFVGKGYVFTTTVVPPVPSTPAFIPTTVVTSYGTGFTGLPAASPSTVLTNASTLLFGSPAAATAPGALPAYNSLRIEARATNTTQVSGYPTTSSVVVTNLVFTGASTVYGSFNSGSISNGQAGNTSGEIVNGSAIAPSTGFWFQRLVSDTNLNTYDWTLTGTVTLDKNGTSGDENVRFIIYGQQINGIIIPPVPEPSRAALMLVGLVAMIVRRKR
jgi:hypothetical protein